MTRSSHRRLCQLSERDRLTEKGILHGHDALPRNEVLATNTYCLAARQLTPSKLILIKLMSDESNKILVIETKINLQSIMVSLCLECGLYIDAWQLGRGCHHR